MKKSILVALLVFMSMFTVAMILPETARATTLYVGGAGPGNFTTIQAAIDNSTSGDTIFIYSGMYYENVVVDRPLSIAGEDRDMTVIEGNGTRDVVKVVSDWVNVSNLSVRNGGAEVGGGIGLYGVHNCVLSGNKVTNNAYSGIFVNQSDNIRVVNNNASDNSYGIFIQFSNNSIVVGDNVFQARGNGINVRYANNVLVANNTVSSENGNGIFLRYTAFNLIDNNTVSSAHTDGISINDSEGDLVFRNTVYDIQRCGINLQRSNYNEISRNNSFSNNYYGICLDDSDSNTIRQNTASSNTKQGIYVSASNSNNIFHNNFIDNGESAYDHGSNDWDVGYPSGGNYWSDYGGVDQMSGPGQDQPGSDGIGDTPYDIPGGFNSDRYPLMDYMPIPPDLVAKSLVSDPPSPVLSGTSVMLNATIANDGGQAALDFAVTLFVDSNHDRIIQMGEEIHIETVSALGPGEETSINHSYLADVEGIHDICVWADPPPDSIEELQEDNNLFCTNLEVFSPTEPRPPSELNARLAGDESRDVLLSWNLSPDDGNQQNPIVRYDVLRGLSYDGSGASYSLHDSVPNATSEYLDVGAGEGDSANYFYTVCTVNMAGDSSCTENQAGKFTRPLTHGPNLISVPLIQYDESIETVLQTVEYDKTWFYDPSSREWKWYMKFKGYRRGLWNINHMLGLWVNVTDVCSLTIAGIVPTQTEIQLLEGWNLVSFPSFSTSYAVADLRIETGASRVEGLETMPPFPPYRLRVLGDADVLQAGYGYWVRVEADAVWTVHVV